MATLEPPLHALPYHEALAAYFQAEEPEVWSRFSASQAQAAHIDLLRRSLPNLGSRLDPASHPELAAAISDAKARLGLVIPVTVYQSQQNHQLRAVMHFLPGEGHLVLQGGVLELLSPAELRAVIGHELAHHLLWAERDQRHIVTDRLVRAMVDDPRARTPHRETARRLRLYTRIFADRGALRVTGDPAPVISAFVKLQTGLASVDVPAYVRQAKEVFARSHIDTEGLSDPEALIRTRAIMLWAKNAPNADAEITRMVEGDTNLEKLDLLAQKRLTDFTERWLRLFLNPAWFRTRAVIAHARRLFPKFEFGGESHSDERLLPELQGVEPDIRDYFCHLLLDFVAITPELDEQPLRAAFQFASALHWDERLEAMVKDDPILKTHDVRRLRAEVSAEAATPGEPVQTP